MSISLPSTAILAMFNGIFYHRKHEHNRHICMAAAAMKAAVAQLNKANQHLDPLVDVNSDQPTNFSDKDTSPLPSLPPKKGARLNPQRAVVPPVYLICSCCLSASSHTFLCGNHQCHQCDGQHHHKTETKGSYLSPL